MKTIESISSSSNNQASLADHANRVLKLGLDVHYRQVTEAMQEDGGRIKSAGKMGHADFLHWVQKKLEEGWQIYSCYEAGASGYWLHREFGAGRSPLCRLAFILRQVSFQAQELIEGPLVGDQSQLDQFPARS